MATEGFNDNLYASDAAREDAERPIEFQSEQQIQVAQAEVAPSAGAALAPAAVAPVPASVVVAIGENNTVKLAAGTSIERIEIDGDNLVLVQPDGTRIVIEHAALHVPTFVIDDVEIPQEALVAALQANDINVAAGPDGTLTAAAGGSESAGGNFDMPFPGIGDAGPIIDLLPPTALQFGALDEREFFPGRTNRGPLIDLDDDGVIGGGGGGEGGNGAGGIELTDKQVMEAGLGIGTNSGSNSEFVHGVFTLSDPDTITDIVSLTINGHLFAIDSLAGKSVDGLYGRLTITSYDVATGKATYVYELTKAFDTNPDTNNGANIEQDRDLFDLTVTDRGGLSGEATIRIDIVDDVPTISITAAGNGQSELAVELDETVQSGNGDQPPALAALAVEVSAGNDRYNGGIGEGEDAGGNANTDDAAGVLARVSTAVDGGLTALFAVTKHYGADLQGQNDIGKLSLTGIPETGLATNLSATNGGPITLYLEGGMIVGKAMIGGVETKVLTIGISGAAGSEQLTTTLFEAINHGSDGNRFDTEAVLKLVGDGSVKLQYEVTIEDGDGDKTTAQGAIDLITNNGSAFSFDDDGPTLTVDAKEGARSQLMAELDETVGSDRYNGSESQDGGPNDDVNTNNGPILAQTITKISDGLTSLFEIGGDAGSDGERDTSGALSFVGIPTEGVATNLSATDGGAIKLLLVNGGIVGRDTQGDDVFTINIVYKNGIPQLQTTLYEAVEHSDDNIFDSEAVLRLVGDGSVQLQYEVTRIDGDGDSITNSATVDLISPNGSVFTFDDDGPKILDAQGTTHIVDEDDMRTSQSTGTSPDDGNGDGSYTGDANVNAGGAATVTGTLAGYVDFGSDGKGGFSISDQAIAHFTSLGLSSKGDDLQYSVNGSVLTAVADGRTVFEFTINPQTGAYEFRLFDQLDHDRPSNGADQNFDLQDAVQGDVVWLDFGAAVRATDGDGDWVDLAGKLEITVRDDVPELVKGGKEFVTVDEDDILNDQSTGTSPDDGNGDGSYTGDANVNAGGAATVTGTLANLVHSGADEGLTFSFIGESSVRNQLTQLHLESQGRELSYDVKDNVLYGFVNASGIGQEYNEGQDHPVFKLTVNADGSYKFELIDQLDHDLGGSQNTGLQGSNANSIDFGSLIKATDFDGDSVVLKDVFKVTVRDDVPELVKGGKEFVTVDEDDILSGQSTGTSPDDGNGDGSYTGNANVNAGGAATVTGTLANLVHSGADDGLTFSFIGESSVRSQLTQLHLESQGRELSYDVKGNVLYGFVNASGIGQEYNEGQDRPVFKLTVNADGSYKFELIDQLDHDLGGNQNTGLQGSNANSIDFGSLIKATDFDGDSVVLKDVFKITVRDDVPEAQIGLGSGAQLVLDESVGADAADLNAADEAGIPNPFAAYGDLIGHAKAGEGTLFVDNSKGGADDVAATVYSLTLGANGSGLTDTATGSEILLKVDGDNVIGYVMEGGAEKVSFVVAVNPDSGLVEVFQYRAIQHPNASDHDEASAPQTLASGAISLVVTVTDFDGDSDSDSADLAGVIRFEDDGPTLTLSHVDGIVNGLFFNGFTPNNDAWGDGSGFTNGSAAGWSIGSSDEGGSGSTLLEKVGDGYRDAHSPTNSVMVDLEATPGNVQVSQAIAGLADGAVYNLTFEIGRGTPNSGDHTGTAKVEVFWNGESIGVFEPNTGNMQTISLPVTAIGGNNELVFKEIGASGDSTGTYLANVKLSNIIIVDETNGKDADSSEVDASSVSALFSGVNAGADADMPATQYAQGTGSIVAVSVDYGSDGAAKPGELAYAFDLGGNGPVDSGLKTTEGANILLVKDADGRVLGVYSNSGAVAFALHIDATSGQVSVAQYVSIWHGDTASHDEGVSLDANTLGVSVTATDGDGDSVTKSLDISGKIRFEDDGPALTVTPNGEAVSLLTIELDETVGGPDRYNVGDTTDGGNHDDVSGALAQVTTSLGSGGLSSLFDVHATYGADGKGAEEVRTFEFTGFPAQGGLLTELSATNGGPITLYLEGGMIVGRDSAGDKVLTIEIAGAPGSEQLTTTLFEAIDHGSDGKRFDSEAILKLVDGSIGLQMTVTVTDGDGDKVTKSATVDLITSDGSPFHFDDDGPVITGVTPDQGVYGPELIVNGGFEDGHGLSGSNWNIFDGITGWTKGGDSVPFEVQTGGAGGVPGNNTAIIELDGDTQTNGGGGALPDADGHTNATIQQTVNGTHAGETYELTFQYTPRGDAATAGMKVTFGGVELTFDSAAYSQGQWHTVTIQVTAPVDNAVLAFTGTGTPDEFGALIDNVSLKAVHSQSVDDENLVDGIAGGPGDDGYGLVSSGKIGFDAGSDGLRSISAELTNGSLQGIHVGTDGVGTPHDISTAWQAGPGAGGTLFGTMDVSGTDVPAFTLEIRPDGTYTFTLQAPLSHPGHGDNGSFEDNLALDFDFTITDGDGDTASSSFSIDVDDDSPALRNGASATITVDEDDLSNHGGDSGNFILFDIIEGSAGSSPNDVNSGTDENNYQQTHGFLLGGVLNSVLNGSVVGTGSLSNLVDFGADGAQAGGGFQLNAGAVDALAGQNLTSKGDSVSYTSIESDAGSIVFGYVSNINDGAIDVIFGALQTLLNGESLSFAQFFQLGQALGDLPQGAEFRLVFALGAESDGDVQFRLFDQLDHGAAGQTGDSDQISIDFSALFSATDSDGDSIGLGEGSFVVKVNDDGPMADIVLKPGALLTLDETVGVKAGDGNANDEHGVADPFGSAYGQIIGHAGIAKDALLASTIKVGADEPGSITFSLSADKTESGLFDTATGDAILLRAEAGKIIGYVNENGAEKVSFVITVDAASGEVGVYQFRAIRHNDPNDHDESGVSAAMLANGAVGLTVTVTDNDNDSRSDSVDLGSIIRFEDDGPVAVADTGSVQEGQTLHVDADGGVLHNDAFGADGSASDGAVVDVRAAGSDTTTAVTAGVGDVIHGVNGTLTLLADGSYSYTANSVTDGQGDVFVYTIRDGDRDLSTATLTITPQDVSGGTASVTAVAETAYEDGADNASGQRANDGTDALLTLTFDMKVTTSDAGDPVDSASIGGIPSGATASVTLSDNTVFILTNGTLTRGADAGVNRLLDDLKAGIEVKVKLAEHDSRDVTLTLQAKVDGTDTGQASATTVVDTVAAQPTLDNPADQLVGESNGDSTSYTVMVTANFADLGDGNEAPQILLGGLPAGWAVTGVAGNGAVPLAGTALGSGLADAYAGQGFTTYGVTPGADGTVTLTVTVTGPGTVDADVSQTLKIVARAYDVPSDGEVAGNLVNNVAVAEQDVILTVQNVNKPLVINGAVSGVVEEEHVLPGGLEDADDVRGLDTDESGPDTVTNQATGSFATNIDPSGIDGDLSFGFAALSGNPAVMRTDGQPLTSGGQPVLFAMDGGNLIGFVDNGGSGYQSGTDIKVFKLTLDPDTGAYTFTLNSKVDHHPVNAADDVEDVIAINLNGRVTVTDHGGPDQDTNVALDASITVIDDIPVAFAPAKLEISNVVGSTATALLDIDGNIDNNVGADQLGGISFANIADGQDSGLTSNGQAVHLYLDAAGKVLTASTVTPEEWDGGANPADETVFTVTLNHNTSGNDTYSVTMSAPVDNGAAVGFSNLSGTGPAGNVPFKIIDSSTLDDLQILFTPIRATTVNSDSDDVAVGGQFIEIANPDNGLRIDFGQFAFHENGGGNSDNGFTINQHETVNGFKFTIDQISSGSTAAVLLKAYDANEGNPNQTIGAHNFADESPVAITEVKIFDASGTLVGTATTDASFDTVGVDFDGGTVKITGLAQGYSVQTNAASGYDRIEVLNAGTSGGTDGKFSLSHLQLETVTTGDPINLSFDLQLTDADGDSIVASNALDITLQPNGVPTAQDSSIVVDEDELTVGGGAPFDGVGNSDSPGDADALPTPASVAQTGSLGSYGPDGKGPSGGIDFSAIHDTAVSGGEDYPTVSTAGAPLSYFWDAATNTLYGTTNTSGPSAAASNAAFKIVVDQNAATYTFELLKPLDHKTAGMEDDIDLSIGYKIKDSTGDAAPGTISVKIDDDMPAIDVAANDPSIVLTTQDADTIGAASDTDSASFASAFTATVAPGADGVGATSWTYGLGITSQGISSGLSSDGAAIKLFMVGGEVIGTTATSTADISAATTVFKIAVDSATGKVTLTQNAEIDHVPNGDTSNYDQQLAKLANGLVTLNATASVTDGDNDIATSTKSIDLGGNIQFADHGPTAQNDFATVVEGQGQKFNAVFVLDFSGSINNTELDQMLKAVRSAGQALFNSTSNEVQIQIVAFSSTARSYTASTDYTSFSNLIKSLNPAEGGARPYDGGTDFTAGIEKTMDTYVPLQGWSNQVFFLSDGNPTEQTGSGGNSLDNTTKTEWAAFLNGANPVNVTTVGIGDGVTDQRLKDVDLDADTDKTPLRANTFDTLIQTLLDAIVSGDVSGNVLLGQDGVIGGGDDDSFGADGAGHILSIKIGGVTYTWDGNNVIDPDNSAANISGTKLANIATPEGGKLTFDFATGEWSYVAPEGHTGTETFTYKLVDGDGDTSSANLEITIVPAPPSVVQGETLITVSEAGLGRSATSEFNEGSLTFHAQAAALAVAFAATQAIVVKDAAADPIDIHWTRSVSGDLLEGRLGDASGELVIKLTLPVTNAAANADTSIPVKVELMGALDHSNAGADKITIDGIKVEASDGTNTIFGTANVAVMDDVPVMGSVENASVDNGVGSVTGGFIVNSGADGVGGASLAASVAPAGLKTEGGEAVSYFVDPANPDVLIAYTGSNPASIASQVFKVTVDPASGEYRFEQFQQLDLASTQSYSVNGSSSFDANSNSGNGSNKDTAYILKAGGDHIALVTGWDSTSPNPSISDLVDVGGSTNNGWGVQGGNSTNDLDPGSEMLRFDFGATNTYGVSNFSSGGFNGVDDVTKVTFSFREFQGKDYTDHVVNYTIYYVEGGNSGPLQYSFTGESKTNVEWGAPAGKTIDYISFSIPSGEERGRIDLESVKTLTEKPLDLTFNVTTADGDGDGVAGAIKVTVDPDSDTSSATSGIDDFGVQSFSISSGEGDDILAMGLGSQHVQAGSDGVADTFTIDPGALEPGAQMADLITGYNITGGDEVDLSALLGDNVNADNIGNFVRTLEGGDGAADKLQVNESGSGNDADFTTVAFLNADAGVKILYDDDLSTTVNPHTP